jgi:hypothetical protein
MSDQPLPAESCATCRFFGRTVDTTRMPSGQCRRKAPGEYEVKEKVPVAPSAFTLHTVTSPFPGVWPRDVCGEYEEARPPTNG